MPGGGDLLPVGVPMFHVSERSLPGSMMVDRAGNRFMNEAQSYTDAVHIMYEHNAQVPCIPAQFIIDSRFRKHYPLGVMLPGKTPKNLLKEGYIIKAASLEELARQLGIDAAGLKETVERFNQLPAMAMIATLDVARMPTIVTTAIQPSNLTRAWHL